MGIQQEVNLSFLSVVCEAVHSWEFKVQTLSKHCFWPLSRDQNAGSTDVEASSVDASVLERETGAGATEKGAAGG